MTNIENSPSFERSGKLQARALKTIPLASQTFSKSAMNLVEGATPLFLERGDGCRVRDVDGNQYIDYVLGLWPIVLGYRDPDVDRAIRDQLDKGITFSLATELEAELAERLTRLIPCAEMVRFGKNGSDATTGAIRLARAHTGRDRVIVCGYHGWHDWYIGTTTRDLGVPRAVQELSTSVSYNDADAVERLFRDDPDGIAALILEPAGVAEPAPGYLERLRELTARHGALLIFDEIITGFHLDLGGAQRYYGVTPDLASFGKAMGNGMPISAVVGSAEVMRGMEDIFFSGTFGGEALSLAAAIATVDKMVAIDGVTRKHSAAERLAAGVRARLAHHGLDKRYNVAGPAWWPRITVADAHPADPAVATSLLRQELTAAGILMGAAFNTCIAHDDDAVIAETLAGWDRACDAVAAAFNDPDPARHLRGKPIRPIFNVR